MKFTTSARVKSAPRNSPLLAAKSGDASVIVSTRKLAFSRSDENSYAGVSTGFLMSSNLSLGYVASGVIFWANEKRSSSDIFAKAKIASAMPGVSARR